MSNPFFYGGPVNGSNFFNRKKELEEIISRMIGQYGSTIISGEPRSGKSSILQRLLDPDYFQLAFSNSGREWIFSFINAQSISTEDTYADFWERALLPIQRTFTTKDPYSSVAKAHRACRKNIFKSQSLEYLFSITKVEGYSFVLLIDEFDAILSLPNLNTSNFYGTLRSLDTANGSAFLMIIASRYTAKELDNITSKVYLRSSPFFNTCENVITKPFAKEDSLALLNLAGERFSNAEKRQLYYVTGGHPYLLQAAAYRTWQSLEDQDIKDQEQRKELLWKCLLIETERTFENIWRNWPTYKKLAFLYVALDHIPAQLNSPRFKDNMLKRIESSLQPDLRSLEYLGYIQKDDTSDTGWKVKTPIFLWWFSDELIRMSRDDYIVEELLHDYKIDGLLSVKDKENIKEFLLELLPLLKDGVATLINAQIAQMGGQSG